MTKDEGVEKSARMEDSQQRLLAQPREVQLVKLADRITNLEPPPAHWSKDRRVAYREEAKRIGDVLGASHAALAARLEARRQAYAQYCES